MSDPRNNGTWLVGVGSDPEIKTISSGSRLIEFRAALDRAKRNSNDPEDTTAWATVTIWDNGNSTKFCFDQVESGKMKKGSQIVVCGSIGIDEYTNKDGVPVQRLAIKADGFTYQGGRSDSNNNGKSSDSGNQQSNGSVINKF